MPVVGDIELFAREAPAPVVAITGTNGKSTVTALLAELASAAGRTAIAGGNLGEPALDLLERPVPELYVLELSSFQLETTHSLATATAAVLLTSRPTTWTATTRSRTTRPPRRASSTAARQPWSTRRRRVVRDMPRAGQRVLSLRPRGRRLADYVCSDCAASRARAAAASRCCRVAALRAAGVHNVANALAALAMCEALGLPRAPRARGARCVRRACPPGAMGRATWRACARSNDSKGTNVGATIAAVAGLAGPLVLIAGGDGKGQAFDAAARGVPRQGAARWC